MADTDLIKRLDEIAGLLVLSPDQSETVIDAIAALSERTPANPAQVTDAMVDAGHNGLEEWRRLYVSKDEIRAILTAAIGAGGQAVVQFRKVGCSDWYDGLPDNEDGRGPYETRTLYTHPAPSGQAVAVKPLDPDMPADQIRLHMGEMTAQEMRTARAAIRWANSAIAHPVQQGWRDMESAPKDGTEILYRNKFGGIGYCHWDEGYNEDEIACWWDNEIDDEVCPVAWLPADTLPAAPQPKGD